VNRKRILFASVVTGVVGAGTLWVLYKIAEPPYESETYQKLRPVYVIVGAVGGTLFGASQEALRQMKDERDEAERARERDRLKDRS